MLRSRPACRPTAGTTFQTIPELVSRAGDRFGDAEAVADGPLRLTFAEWIVAAFGLLTAGGVLVPIGTRLKAAEADEIITRSPDHRRCITRCSRRRPTDGICRRCGSR